MRILDPLHCAGNGTNSPTNINSLADSGFTVSPGPASGDLVIDILALTDEATPGSSSTRTLAGTASLFSATPWTSGDLDAYLGISASPTSPIGAFLPSTQALEPGAARFFFFPVDLGSALLQDPSTPNSNPLENISPGLSLASYIVGFLNEGTASSSDWVVTANIGAIFETPVANPLPGDAFRIGFGRRTWHIDMEKASCHCPFDWGDMTRENGLKLQLQSGVLAQTPLPAGRSKYEN